MFLRFRYRVQGAHVHVRVFGAKQSSATLARCGELAFRDDEWDALMPVFKGRGWECVNDTPTTEVLA